ncbi:MULTISPECIES: nitrogenase iron-molybdenum cofactor biosynthesis protein NifN [Actibacterium]|uniref:Nitrogenase iron-molybdenum cofactor biosynthesis protein NifN n=1 Tax=Actibacterium naphthalenivorans TaxID=1614693 RepID=A0A840C5G3_9RHOB|nr:MULTISPECIES: nitrogenase iron-molybdenum cofactor biosynthesis protein NifN [Actibacterium]ALG89635.1 nitrogenase molybdenum-cofactor biosynthesis protein NifN [Actibacterium sp. EMB200-NS6]MBB4020695.1 nitrogenase molybdenum-iron protein NifN [Actibacterium naphthalenivorans]
MAKLVHPRRALSTNPLKSSAPLGAALAYLGIEGAIPLFHGSQGCTAFAMVHLVRHFKEAVPLQTTAMNEVSTILGGADQIEEAIENLRKKSAPKFIGIASTALTETRGEDVPGELREIIARRADFADTRIVYASTPDFAGGLEDGWARAVEAIIDALVPEVDPVWHSPELRQVNLLVGSHATPAEIEEMVRMIRAFGLTPIVLPDISTSLDGHVSESWAGTSLGGTALADIEKVAHSAFTLAVGESMRPAARLIEERACVPYRVFQSLTGLKPVDAFVRTLMGLSGVDDAPPSIKRDRSRLLDASLDAHFHIGGLKLAVGADPDLLFALSSTLAGLGAEVVTAVTTSNTNGIVERVPAETVILGDLGDLERAAKEAGAQMLITNAHGRHAAHALHLPLIRAGFPIFDRLGAQDICRVGYRGTRAFLYETANAVQAQHHRARPEDFGAAPISEEFEHVPPTASH